MFEKIKSYQDKPSVRQLRDVRVLGLLIFGFLVLLVSWSGVKVIQVNYGLEQRISKLQQENEVRELENSNLKLRNQYYNTKEFLELAARRQFGKAAPGETLILVPKQVALAHATSIPGQTTEPDTEPTIERPQHQKNFEAWINFFLHRQTKQ